MGHTAILPEFIKISLIGPQGCGKSAIAKGIGLLLKGDYGRNIKLYESDALLEDRLGMKIPTAFEKFGADHVRQIEGDIIEEFSTLKEGIFSSGGGAPYPTGCGISEDRLTYHSSRNKNNLENSYVVYPRPSESIDESVKICNWRISGAKNSTHRISLPPETLKIRDPHYIEISNFICYSKYGLPNKLVQDIFIQYCKDKS